MKSSNLKYLKNKKFYLNDILYLKKKNIKKKDLLDLVEPDFKKKIIILNSENTDIKLPKKYFLELKANSINLRNLLKKLTNFKIFDTIKIKTEKNVYSLKRNDVLLKSGILFNNKKITNADEIKLNFIQKQINDKKSKLITLYKRYDLLAYLVVTFTKNDVCFYDVNIKNPKKNGYLITCLFKYFFTKYNKGKFKNFTTSIHEKNIRALNFFKSLGFKVAKKRTVQILIY